MASRNETKSQNAIKQILKCFPKANIRYINLDLGIHPIFILLYILFLYFLFSHCSTADFPSAKQSVITNSYFSFFDKHGMIVCSAELWATILSFELSLAEDHLYDMTLINNSFELNTNNTL
eukprot:1036165_1